VIRRGFWLATGAVLGVAGYRKAARLARTITASPAASPALTTPGRAGGRFRLIQPRATQPRALQPRATQPRAVESRLARPRAAAQARDAVPVTHRIRAAVGFARDVRYGMAEYRDLHPRQLGRRLGSRSSGPPDDRAVAGRGGSRGGIQP
jgi:hypothetical protein